MQTASYVDIDNWEDIDPRATISNIRPKGTYKPVVQPETKPVVPPTCPIDNQPIPVPCDLCPVNNMEECQNNPATYGSPEPVPMPVAEPSKRRGRPAGSKNKVKKTAKK